MQPYNPADALKSLLATLKELTPATAAVKSLLGVIKDAARPAPSPLPGVTSAGGTGQSFGSLTDSYTAPFKEAAGHAQAAWASLKAASRGAPASTVPGGGPGATGPTGGVPGLLGVIINQLGGILAGITKIAGGDVQDGEEFRPGQKVERDDGMPETMGAGERWKLLGSAVLHATQAATTFTSAITGMFGKLAEGGIGLLRQPLHMIDAGISAINMNVARFVQLASPAHFQLFQRAADDLYASIGYALLPVMEKMTALVRAVGSAIYGTTSQGRQLIAALAAGAVGMIAFSAAVMAVQAVATGGIGPLLGGIIGLAGGMAFATGEIKPLLDTMHGAVSGFLEQGGAVVRVLTSSFQQLLPVIGELAHDFAGFASYLAGAVSRAAPGIMAFVGTILEVSRPVLTVAGLIGGALIESLVTVSAAFAAVSPVIVGVAKIVSSIVSAVAGPIGIVIGFVGKIAADLAVIAAGPLRFVGALLTEFSIIITKIADTVGRVMKDLLALIGISFGAAEQQDKSTPLVAAFGGGAAAVPARDNTGAAARQASTTTMVSVLQKARENAFSLGWGPQEKPEKKTAENTNLIAEAIREIKILLDKFARFFSLDTLGSLPEAVYQGVYKALVWLYNQLKGLLSGLGNVNIPGTGGLTPKGVADKFVDRGQQGLDELRDAANRVGNQVTDALPKWLGGK